MSAKRRVAGRESCGAAASEIMVMMRKIREREERQDMIVYVADAPRHVKTS